MGSANPHYCTHIKYKYVSRHSVAAPHKSVSIKKAMNLPLKLVYRVERQAGEELCAPVTTRCLRVIQRKCWPTEHSLTSIPKYKHRGGRDRGKKGVRNREKITKKLKTRDEDIRHSLYLRSCFSSHTFTPSWTQSASHPSMPERGYGWKPGFTQKQHGCPVLPSQQTQHWTELVSFSLQAWIEMHVHPFECVWVCVCVLKLRLQHFQCVCVCVFRFLGDEATYVVHINTTLCLCTHTVFTNKYKTLTQNQHCWQGCKHTAVDLNPSHTAPVTSCPCLCHFTPLITMGIPLTDMNHPKLKWRWRKQGDIFRN